MQKSTHGCHLLTPLLVWTSRVCVCARLWSQARDPRSFGRTPSFDSGQREKVRRWGGWGMWGCAAVLLFGCAEGKELLAHLVVGEHKAECSLVAINNDVRGNGTEHGYVVRQHMIVVRLESIFWCSEIAIFANLSIRLSVFIMWSKWYNFVMVMTRTLHTWPRCNTLYCLGNDCITQCISHNHDVNVLCVRGFHSGGHLFMGRKREETMMALDLPC